MNGLYVNNKLESILKEAVVVYFMVLPRHSSAGSEKNHENFSQYSRSADRDMNPGPPKYEAVVLTIRSRRSDSLQSYSYNVKCKEIFPLRASGKYMSHLL
jgi:hypothetical protein